MTRRTTIKELEALCERINTATGSPEASYTRKDGKLRANVGNYHIDQAYGGVNLARMCNEGGGITCPLGLGYRTKRELANEMRACLAGMEAKNAVD